MSETELQIIVAAVQRAVDQSEARLQSQINELANLFVQGMKQAASIEKAEFAGRFREQAEVFVEAGKGPLVESIRGLIGRSLGEFRGRLENEPGAFTEGRPS